MAINKGDYRPISPILPLKIVCHGNIPLAIEKSRFLIHDQIPIGENLMKIGTVDSVIALLRSLF